MLKALQQKRADKVRAWEALVAAAEAADRGLTDEEKASRDTLRGEIAALDERIAEAVAVAEAQKTAPVITPAHEPPNVRVERVHDNEEDKPWGHESGAAFGEFLIAVRNAKVSGVIDKRLYGVAQGAGEVIGEDGGFLVSQDMITDLSKAIMSGSLLSRVQRIPLRPGSNGVKVNVIRETSRATGSRWGAVQGYWVDEGTAPTASRPKFDRVALELKKVAALGYSGDELLDDAPAFQTVITRAFADELQFLVEDAIINGTGAGQPQGILNAACLVSVAKETGQAASTIVTANLSKMWARFMGSNPVWFINRDVNPQLDELSIPAGTGALEPRFVTYGSDGLLRIKGAPVVEIEYCPTLGTVGDIILADMSAYGFIDGGGVRQAASMHVAFTTDEMAFRATMRVDGQALPRSALTPFKGSNTRSPFVALATRS